MGKKSLLLRQVRPQLNPGSIGVSLRKESPAGLRGTFALAEKGRFDRATGSGARVNEPKTVRRTVFGEAKAPKQGAFRAVIYGGDGRRLATRRALACLHAEIISPSPPTESVPHFGGRFLLADQSSLNSPSFRAGRRGNSKALAIRYSLPFLLFGREPRVAPSRIRSDRRVNSLLLRAFGYFFTCENFLLHLIRRSAPPTRLPSHSRTGRTPCRSPRTSCFGQDRFTKNSPPDCFSLANPSRGRLGTRWRACTPR